MANHFLEKCMGRNTKNQLLKERSFLKRMLHLSRSSIIKINIDKTVRID